MHYKKSHISLFIIKKGHYSLIIIPHPDPHIYIYIVTKNKGVNIPDRSSDNLAFVLYCFIRLMWININA